ncbi:alginate lyase family protein [Tunturiibacter empetritectus]|uniref:Alginate lyase domain-containing protein n=2 Tax=Tunturiibacter TaxID=3154218 RepID=A0A852V6V8_9BACT|nr:alginate lyase family protein [Edaphobacter lichenicola]NYF88728.1 hypothetical protein [Edaphobacter lichenicola]
MSRNPQKTLTRRTFCASVAAAALTRTLPARADSPTPYNLIARTDRNRILRAAALYLKIQPQTITSFPAPASSEESGGPETPLSPHDFYSQADYFWPDPANPTGPYLSRDGQSNPNIFHGHRQAMIALSIQMPALTAAWLLTRNQRYAQHAADHLRAWFLSLATRMNPNLQYAQAVHGAFPGRSYGIIDTLHLVEVARAASLLPAFLTPAERATLNAWFRDYLDWLQSSKPGVEERNATNNHAACWSLQAAEYARLIDDEPTRAHLRTQLKTILLPNQMAPNGSFPKELARTKPYSYSIFNFDVMATLCQSLSTPTEDLFAFQLSDGRGICQAAAFLFPYLEDKTSWPYKKDVEHFDILPVRSPGLLFCGLACHHQPYIKLWQHLNPDPTDPEIIRNCPIRQPILWFAPPT